MLEYKVEVDRLIKAYARYKQILQIEAGLSTQLAKQKIIGNVDAQIYSDHEQAMLVLQTLSDSMTFSNPFVWIMYKFEAYKDEAQPIRTMLDFRIHCSKAGDICAKRFLFVNEQLVMRKHLPLTDTVSYDDNVSLDKLLEEESVQELVNDPVFINLWRGYEYNTEGGRVAKWNNYST